MQFDSKIKSRSILQVPSHFEDRTRIRQSLNDPKRQINQIVDRNYIKKNRYMQMQLTDC